MGELGASGADEPDTRPAGVDEAAADAGPPAGATKRSARWPYALLTLAALALAAALAYKPVAEALVLRAAREHGVLLQLGAVELGLSEVVLTDFRFALDGAPVLRGQVERLVIRHERGKILGLSANGVELALTGSASLAAVQLSDWAARRPELLGLPSRADGVSLTWRSQADEEPWLAIAAASVVPTDSGARLQAERARVAGVSVGPVGASWGRDAEQIRVSVGRSDPQQAPVVVDIVRGAPHRATIELRPTPLEALAAPLDVPLPIKGVTASGKVSLAFAELEHGAVEGSVEALFVGYKPPVPPELNAFVFGDKSTLSTNFSLSPSREKLLLRDTHVQHGGFKLEGGGEVLRHPRYATVHLELRAALSCAILADAAARTRLGPQLGAQLGAFIGGVARANIDGSVGIRLVLDADSRELEKARLQQHVGLGCGLAALRKLPGWPNDLGALMNQLPGGQLLPRP